MTISGANHRHAETLRFVGDTRQFVARFFDVGGGGDVAQPPGVRAGFEFTARR